VHGRHTKGVRAPHWAEALVCFAGPQRSAPHLAETHQEKALAKDAEPPRGNGFEIASSYTPTRGIVQPGIHNRQQKLKKQVRETALKHVVTVPTSKK